MAALYAAAFVLSVVVMGGAVIVITDRALRDQLLQSSQADIAAIQHGYASEGIPEAQEVVEQLNAAPGASDFFLLQRGTTRLAGNLPRMIPQTGTVTLPGSSADHRILGVGAFLAPDVYVFSGSDLYRVNVARRHLLSVLSWLFGATLLLAISGGALVSRSFLRRTDAIATACRAIMDGNMKARIIVRGSGDELDRLADSINAMLDRIAGLMENLRQVTNDIAHDLRTPVTHLRSRLERASTESASTEDYAQAIQAAIAKSDEVLALFNALLRIAQLEGGARRAAFTSIQLADLLAHMCDLFGAVAEEADHQLELRIKAPATIRGDRQLLVQLLSNLIENAILHTPAHTRITLSLAVVGDRAIVLVSDNGPGVPREEFDKLFQRLYRREASRTRPGYGLGLSLVAALAELHGASVAIAEQAGPGLCVRVAFPLSAEGA